MFRQIVVPTEKDHKITLPPDLYDKQVEVIAFEIDQKKAANVKQEHFLEDIEPISDFPSIEKIRSGAWPGKK